MSLCVAPHDYCRTWKELNKEIVKPKKTSDWMIKRPGAQGAKEKRKSTRKASPASGQQPPKQDAAAPEG